MADKITKIVPTKKKFLDTAKAGIRMGVAGGLPTLLLSQVLGGVLGRVAGGIVGGAFLKDSVESKVVVGNAIQDSIIMLGM